MKKFLSSIIVAAAMIIALPANAQISFGLRGGLNINKVSFDGKKDIKSDNQAGFFVGPVAEVKVPLAGLSADIGVLYDQKKVKLEAGADKETKTLNYIDVPVNVKYTFGIGRLGGIYIATGPQFAFNLDGKQFDIGDISGTANQYELKKSEFSWNLGGGVSLLGHLRVGYNYNFGIGKTAELKDASAWDTSKKICKSFKNQTHQISLTYIF